MEHIELSVLSIDAGVYTGSMEDGAGVTVVSII